MIYIAWVFSLGLVYYLGFQHNKIMERLRALEAKWEIRRKKDEETPSSTIIDPYDVVQKTQLEHRERMRKLNPDNNDL